MGQQFRSILRALVSKKSLPLVNTFRVLRTLLRKENVGHHVLKGLLHGQEKAQTKKGF